MIGRFRVAIRVLDGRVQDEPARGPVLLGQFASGRRSDRADDLLACRVEDLDRDVVRLRVDDEARERLARSAGRLVWRVVGQELGVARGDAASRAARPGCSPGARPNQRTTARPPTEGGGNMHLLSIAYLLLIPRASPALLQQLEDRLRGDVRPARGRPCRPAEGSAAW